MRPITAVLFHESQTIAEDAEKGTRPAAWANPQLVKEGTYDAAAEAPAEPTTAMIVAPASNVIDVEYTVEAIEPKRLAAPAQKQLSLF